MSIKHRRSAHITPPVNAGQILRQQAEAVARVDSASLSESLEEFSPDAIRQMVHELRVHQIELEMQNEELRRTQVELDASRAHYFDLYDLAPVGYCTISESGQILQANLSAAGLLGTARAALAKQPFSRFICNEDQDIYYQLRKRLFETGEPQWCDLRLVKPDGAPFWSQLAATLVQDDDGAPLLRIVMNDISDRKRVEAERALFDRALQDKNIELERAKFVAEKANLAKSDFLSSMSHELRTPLSAILGFAQLIESGTPPPTLTQRRSVDQILKAGWYLLELINEILDLAVIESGKLSLSLEAVSLAEVMRECETMIETQGRQHGISVTFPRFDLPHLVRADRTRVKQILINLLSNAIKYNKTGGTVTVACVPTSSDAIRISVHDSGLGLAPEQLAQLFVPFNRLGQEAKAEQGTGIGLVVCKRLIELMGGLIGVESAVGQGSVFWIELKLADGAQAAAGAAESTAYAAQAQAGTKVTTLLFVEDNPGNLMLVEEIVSRRPDIRLLSTDDGTRGISLARTARPDVILMDINLSGIDGFQALRILADDPITASIPVIALSANAMPHDIEKGLNAGFFRYLTKPIKVKEFLETLDVALEFATTESAKVRAAGNKP